jgi:iron complex outermembrane receptor protein
MKRYSRALPGQQPGLALAAAIAALTTGAPALAQEEAVNEIIVTVRQRAEAIEDVPGAVVNFGSDDIKRLGLERARDFVNQTPGVSIVQTSAEVGDSQVNIRGINGARDAETNYALVIDGILMTNPSALNREYTNLQSFQVFKGPQGAIYGRNAAAGAFIINTQEPGQEVSGAARISVAEDDTKLVTGNIGGGVTETLRVGLTGTYRDSDGYYRNAYQDSIGRNTDVVDNFESWDVSARAIWEPTDKVKVDTKLRYGEVDAASIAFNSVFHIPSLATLLGPGGFGFPADFAAFANENVNTHQFQFDNNIIPTNNQEATEFSVKVDYDLGWADLTAWGLYSNIENNLSADGTSAAFQFFATEPRCRDTTANLAFYPVAPPQFIGPTPEDSIYGGYTPTSCDGTQFQERNQKDYSFEVRLASKADQRLRWLGGLYYLDLQRDVAVNTGIDLDGSVAQTIYAGPSSNNPTEALVADRFDTNVYAVFGSIAYDLTDSIEASFALRYDREEREATSRVPTDAVTQYIDTCGDGGIGGDPINPGLCFGQLSDQDETFDQWQPKFSLTWDVTDAITTYASVGVGFKSGGFNNQGSAATVNLFTNTPLIYGTGDPGDPSTWNGDFSEFAPVLISDKYDEETSTAYEVGAKGRFLDGRLRTEVALFRTDVDDMQFFEFFVGGFGLLRVVSNIDEVELQGFELSGTFAATDWLNLFAGYSYVDSEIKKNTVRPDTVGNESPYTPEWTGNIGAQVTFPMTDTLDFIGSIDASFVGDTWFHVVQANDRPTGFSNAFGIGPANYEIAQRDAYGVVNLRAGIGADSWSVSAFVTNLLDENYLEEVIPAPEFGGSFISPGTQRRFGVEANFRF